jgi:arginine/lysine/ornithine decarboxylase
MIGLIPPGSFFDVFNEAFMMHGTTSPFYPMIASIDVATAMMDKPAGPTQMQETILLCQNMHEETKELNLS